MIPSFQIANLSDGDILGYPLVIISGKIKSFAFANNYSHYEVSASVNNADLLNWPVLKNKTFKAIVSLKKGVNRVQLKYGDYEHNLELNYSPHLKEKFVRLVYIVCNDSSGEYQASDGLNTCEIARQKLRLGARLIQSIAAEKLHEHHLARRTFALEEYEDGEVECHVFVSELNTAQVYAMKSEELWSHFAQELMASHLNENGVCKFLAFLSATRYACIPNQIPVNHTQVIQNTNGHVALGGGGLALFGTGCLYTWASDLKELREKLTDERKVDRETLMDDSCNRGTYWACYSSGLGAILHELAHTFDIGHSKQGIMGLGFHEIQKDMLAIDTDKCCVCPKTRGPPQELSWTLSIQPHSEKPPKWQRCSNCGDGCFWTRSQALMLFFHPWFRPPGNNFETDKPLSVQGSVIYSESGMQLVEVRDQTGMYLFHSEHLGNLNRRLDLKSLMVSVPIKFKSVTLAIQSRAGSVEKREIDVKKATFK